jgi:hypothetical protein
MNLPKRMPRIFAITMTSLGLLWGAVVTVSAEDEKAHSPVAAVVSADAGHATPAAAEAKDDFKRAIPPKRQGNPQVGGRTNLWILAVSFFLVSTVMAVLVFKKPKAAAPQGH